MDDFLQELGTVLTGRYTLERELGRGGMATVYLGRDHRHDRQVALKVLSPDVAASLGADRFLREIQIAARLSHPHILPLHDSGRAGRFVYYVMPYVPGETLRARITREGQLTIEDAITIGREVAGALGYAHSHDVVHRDIKPENILFQGGHAVVVDFGIGRAIGSAGEDHITQPGLSIGTPGYMSPEQVSGSVVDGRSDVYSLGCVLYEMLTGRRPDPPSLRKSWSPAMRMPTPRALRAAVPDWVDQAVMRALAPLPADRFPTASQLSAALAAPTAALSRIGASGPHGGMPTSIVVLPFTNMSPDPEAEFFSDGITEEIINALTRVDSLRVASRTSSFALKGKGQDIRAIGEQLNANAVLEGSVRRAGNRLRITAQLTNTADGYHLWGERFDRDLEDVFAIQDEISRAIVSTLKIKLSGEADARLVYPPTENMEAYTLYLKGRYYWNKRYEVGLHRGLEFFQAAIARDPGYALAHAGIADSFSVMGFYGYLPPAIAYGKAREAAEQVMQLDPALADGHFSLGMIALWHDWNWRTAEHEFATALALRPNQAEIHIFVSQLTALLGDIDASIAASRRAVALDPVSPLVNAMASWPYYISGRHAEAIEQCNRALEIDPAFPVALWLSALANMEMGNHAEAIEAASKGVTLSQRSTFLVGTLGCAQARAGLRHEANQALVELQQRGASGYVAPFHTAVIHACLGDTDRALDDLERAYVDRTPNLVTISILPILKNVRDLPRAVALRRKMGL